MTAEASIVLQLIKFVVVNTFALYRLINACGQLCPTSTLKQIRASMNKHVLDDFLMVMLVYVRCQMLKGECTARL